MGFWIILCNFWSITKNSYSSRPLIRNHSYIWFGKSPETLFLVYSFGFVQMRMLWPIFTILVNNLRKLYFRLLSNRCSDFDEIWLIYASKKAFSSLFRSSVYDLYSPNNANELLGYYVTCVCTMYYYMLLCNITFLTSLKRMHEFVSIFVWVFLGWTHTKLDKIGVLLLFYMVLRVILFNFWPIINKYYSLKPLTRNHSYNMVP